MLGPIVPARFLLQSSTRHINLRSTFARSHVPTILNRTPRGPNFSSFVSHHLSRSPLSASRPSLLFRRPARKNVRLSSTGPPPQPSLSTTQKVRELSRKYGWAAFYIYLGLSALDFPFCFLAVRLLGPERIGEAEHYVVNTFWKLVGAVMPSMKPVESLPEEAAAPATAAEVTTPIETEIARNGADASASIWTQLLLAYGVHKSLIFFRVPLTAAVTPNIVKYLRRRGWNVGLPKA